jgi:hypothetical protein
MNCIRLPIAVLCSVTLFAGCSSGGDDGSGTQSLDGSVSTTVVTQDAGTSQEPPPSLPPVIEGLDSVTLLTPVAGGGARPLLAWEPVNAAATYMVVVYDSEGEAIWSSITRDTEIYLGGSLPIPEENTGPRITADSSWVVYADDANGRVIAASGRSPLNP